MLDGGLFALIRLWDPDVRVEATHEEMLPPSRDPAVAVRWHRGMAQRLGVADDRLVAELAAVGYGPDTVALLEIAPLVEMAWVDGHVSGAERDVIADIASVRTGCGRGSIGAQQLAAWLLTRPSDRCFRASLTALRALLSSVGPKARLEIRGRLLRQCTRVAAASRGRLGLGRRIAGRERRALARIAAMLDISERDVRKVASF